MIKNFLKFALISVGLISSLFLFIAIVVLSQIPSKKELQSCLTTKLYQVYLCPGSKDYTPISQISSYMQKSVVISEDSAFWQHNGFDFSEMQKSLETNLKKGRFARGGSTITQQLAKNLFLTKEKTLWRKGLEAIITLRIEKYLSKKEILEKYLNVVQFGKNIFGIKAAARIYFNKSPSQLSIVESSFLTFLLPSPEKYSISFTKKQLTPFAKMRLRQIIDHLYQYSRISSSEYESARAELASLWPNPKDSQKTVDESSEQIEQELNNLDTDSIEELSEPDTGNENDSN